MTRAANDIIKASIAFKNLVECVRERNYRTMHPFKSQAVLSGKIIMIRRLNFKLMWIISIGLVMS